jgi:hypothetical protein
MKVENFTSFLQYFWLQVTATKYRNIEIFNSLLGILGTPKNHFIFTVFICNKRLLGKDFGGEIKSAVPKGHEEFQTRLVG